MKHPSSSIGKTDLSSRGMHEVAMQTAEPTSTKEANEIIGK